VTAPRATYAAGDGKDPRTWNLLKDVYGTGNQISFNQGARGVWYFMESHSLVHNSLIYRFMPEYHAPALFFGGGGSTTPDGFSCWSAPDVLPDVCFNFNNAPVTLENYEVPPRSVQMHPGVDQFSIVAWQSPVNGVVNVNGSFGDLNANCGNGVLVFIDKGSQTLWSADLPNGGKEGFALSKVKIEDGDVLYFIVDPKAENFGCDSTSLDLTITEHMRNGEEE